MVIRDEHGWPGTKGEYFATLEDAHKSFQGSAEQLLEIVVRLRELARLQDCVAWAGSGLSAAARYPDGKKQSERRR